MKRTILLILGLLLPLAARAQDSAPGADNPADPNSVLPPEMAARYAHAVWTYPDGGEMADMYPMRAADENLSGAVVITCLISPDGRVDQCGIEAEAPKGYGFGLATATAFVRYAHVDPATVEGGIKPGDFRSFTYRWTLNN